jgi:membrane protein required for colicin V production
MLHLFKHDRMGFLDIVFGLLMLWGLWKGLKNGLLLEIAAIIALIAGLYGAIHFSYITGKYLSRNFDWNEQHMNLAAFIITFIIIVLAVHLAGKLLTKIADLALLGFVNKLAGGIFGVLKVAVILGALLIFIDHMHYSLGVITEETKAKSIFYNPLKDIGSLVFDKVLKKQEPDNEAP